MESPSAPGAVLGNGAAGADMVTSLKGPHTTHMGAELKGAQSLPEEATLNLSPAGGGGQGRQGTELQVEGATEGSLSEARPGAQRESKTSIAREHSLALPSVWWVVDMGKILWDWLLNFRKDSS